MVYTQVPLNTQNPSPGTHFDDGANANFSAYVFKDGHMVPVVNQQNNLDKQPMMPPVVVHPQTRYEDQENTLPALCLFIAGFFFVIPWIVNCVYIKSKNRIARALAISSVTLFAFSALCLILYFCLIVYVANDDDE
ncbi:hypothetical protein DICPUDRAFT_91687 [Dictyostelium purpureum]|uniref:Uncharacterized protein n=1 Tax=Dictyostelium purpureum TaxID=5786 RepID=F0ZFX9_DICPU|nr:uncharacterized protein DICPUDRAFT_91687 [Dictyostelium purpureum]EGC37141.1 hypothetical protein DICPUDRAFT_91687 [Dictyostelium purpureum]|eukprot:XP_003286344.1 hypothetical protein DICPUDRAFT_91687 [Dictyostelium purpureum]